MRAALAARGAKWEDLPMPFAGQDNSEIAKVLIKEFGFKKADLDGIDPQAATEWVESVRNVYAKYPELNGYVDEIGMGASGDTIAQWWHRGKRIELNQKLYMDLTKRESVYQRAVKDKYRPAGTTYKANASHELGHAMADMILDRIGKTTKWFKTETLRMAGSKPDKVGNLVSRYAETTTAEFFAECFAELIESKRPRKVARIFGIILTEALKEMRGER